MDPNAISSEMTARPDYEAMYKASEERIHRLQVEKEKLHHACDCFERENEKLRAQLEIVHLIFGGFNR